MTGEIIVRPDQFMGAREAARNLSTLVNRLDDGESALFVILHRNKPRAVLLSMNEYERLLKERV